MTNTGVTDDMSEIAELDIAAEIAESGSESVRDGHPTLSAAVPPEEPLKDRLLLPALLPLLCIVAVVVYAVNISRVFLAGDSTAALVIATGITIAILAGGAVLSASPRVRTPSLAMLMGLVLVIVIGAGLLSLGPSLGHGEEESRGYVEPQGSPDYTVEVVAGPGTVFNSDRYETGAGITEIDYTGQGGHTLVFADPDLVGFKLDTDGGKPTGKVELQPGEYTIYCDVIGHRAGGMEATLVVGT